MKKQTKSEHDYKSPKILIIVHLKVKVMSNWIIWIINKLFENLFVKCLTKQQVSELLTQGQVFELRQRGRGTQLVEDVVVPLILSLQKEHRLQRSGNCLIQQRCWWAGLELETQLRLKAFLRHRTHLKHHSGFLQQIGAHVGADDVIPPVKTDLDVFSETAAVVVTRCLCISNSLWRKTGASRKKNSHSVKAN